MEERFTADCRHGQAEARDVHQLNEILLEPPKTPTGQGPSGPTLPAPTVTPLVAQVQQLEDELTAQKKLVSEMKDEVSQTLRLMLIGRSFATILMDSLRVRVKELSPASAPPLPEILLLTSEPPPPAPPRPPNQAFPSMVEAPWLFFASPVS